MLPAGVVDQHDDASHHINGNSSLYGNNENASRFIDDNSASRYLDDNNASQYINDDNASQHINCNNASRQISSENSSTSDKSFGSFGQLYTTDDTDGASNQSYGYSLEDGIGSKKSGSSPPAEGEVPSSTHWDMYGLQGQVRYNFAEHENDTIAISTSSPQTKVSGLTDLGTLSSFEARGAARRGIIGPKKMSIKSILSGLTDGSRGKRFAKKASVNSKSTLSGLSDVGTQTGFNAGERDSRVLKSGAKISSNDKRSDIISPPSAESPRKTSKSYKRDRFNSASSDKRSSMPLALTRRKNKSYQRECIAPPGRLGVVINSTNGPIVHAVKKGSPLEHVIFPGDRILAIDKEDTRGMTAHGITAVMAKRITHERTITVSSIHKS